MFFHFLKIIFDISTSKRSKKYKPHSILAKKKKIQNLIKHSYKRNAKRCRSLFICSRENSSFALEYEFSNNFFHSKVLYFNEKKYN